ncbi:Reverse transcriptase (RNA-dependent DNA polymerase) [Falsiroseomonas stagni DSM 19981]|uniref:Reverse transcriptase (RNA-dependent DNA polymerase) n=2 Tax=Falsiroseomonas TaxID=2870713 RepID=A0A1I4AF39_9PROT|nr:Reverse transcriptase (RNA-dependent DNA polymerase) [Falsiroseomonas stagni DSM 19981]
MLSIVNPINQLHVSDLIGKNWLEIKKRIARSTISEFDPQIVLVGNTRAVTGVNFDGVARRRAEILGAYGRYVRTDVARFYPSIYTHAIPWAILGKEYVKANQNNSDFKTSFGNLLDKAVAAGQQGQTVGIPIGPDTSRIVSELIASEVEAIAHTQIRNLEHRAVRYVDDMLIGLHETETPSAVLSALSNALYEFELELNADKTSTHGIGASHSPEWIHYIRTFDLNQKKSRQRDDLDSYFEQIFHLADSHPKDNVVLFAAKRAASFTVDQTNMSHLVRWLLYAARRAPSCLSFIVEHLSAISVEDFMSDNEIKAYILQQLPRKAEAVHTHEVAWLLFWAREMRLSLPSTVMGKITDLRSSVVAMLTLDLMQNNLIAGEIDISAWRASATAEGLRSGLWLVAYEATKREWWPMRQASGFVSGHQFFGDIWERNIYFYDPAKKIRSKSNSSFSLNIDSGSGFSFGSYPDVRL